MVQSLIEVHSVQVFIKKIEGASNEIYGHITIDDNGCCNVDIFKADKQHAQPIASSGGILPLSGPFRCIMAETCRMAVSLKEKHRDLEVSLGFISFSRVSLTEHDKPLSFFFQGDYGYAIIHLSLVKYAIQACVDVVFVPKGGSRQSNIFGEVSAQYSSYTYKTESSMKYDKTRLFDFPREKAMKLSTVPQDGAEIIKIPLSRSVVAAPLDGWLLIDTKLWVKNSEISSEDDPSQLVSGTALFFPRMDAGGEDTEYIEGNFGQVEVRVTWLVDVGKVYGVCIHALGKKIDEMANRIKA